MQAQQSSGGNGSLPECECIVCKLVAKGFSTYNFEEKRQIISTGRPTPALRNLTKQTKLYLYKTFSNRKLQTLRVVDGL